MSSPEKPPESSQDWRDLRPLVLSMVRKGLGPFLRSKLESADVVQDVLGAVAEDSGQWEGERGTHFLAWVEGVVRHRICNLDKLHKAKKRGAGRALLPLADESSVDGAVEVAVDMSAAERLESQQDVTLLLQCMEGLTDDHRRLILLREYEGCSWQDVAAKTDRPTGDAARMAHGRALSQLSLLFLQAKRQGRGERREA